MPVPNEIQRLCSPVPWPPGGPRAGPATDDQIATAEVRVGRRFPSQFREFLKYLNGPCIGPGGILGVEAAREGLDLCRILSDYPEWNRRGWLPVAGDGCGNYYVLVLSEEGESPVAFIDTASSPETLAYVVASDFWHFVTFLLQAELRKTPWPFSRADVLRDDPSLAECQVAPLPWDA